MKEAEIKREEAPQEEQQVVPAENHQDEMENKVEDMDRLYFPDSPVNKLTEMTDSSDKEIGDRYTEEYS